MVSPVVTFHLEFPVSYETAIVEPVEDVTEESVTVISLHKGDVVGLVHV